MDLTYKADLVNALVNNVVPTKQGVYISGNDNFYEDWKINKE